MKIENRTPFKLLPIPTQPEPPTNVLTVILKATFDLVANGVCAVAAEQRAMQADAPHLDELGRSLAWASDMVPFKPRGEVVVHGAFYAPGGMPVHEGRARLEIGPIAKELQVHSPRFAEQTAAGWRISPGKPVSRVPLRWEYALGGLNDRRNPLGTGLDLVPSANGHEYLVLPLIECPSRPYRLPGERGGQERGGQERGGQERGVAANFAPVPPVFEERLKKRGTRDRRWAVFRAPLPPDDYDISVHNAAPSDQQIAGYWRGDETVVLHNLHPDAAVLRTRLPGLRPRIGVLRRGSNTILPEEIAMHADTIAVLPDDGQVVIVWRGLTAIHGSSHITTMPLLWAETESIAEPPAPFDAIADRMLELWQELQPPGPEADIAAANEAVAGVKKRIAEMKLPDGFKAQAAKEKDPQKLFSMMQDFAKKQIEALEASMQTDPKLRAAMDQLKPKG